MRSIWGATLLAMLLWSILPCTLLAQGVGASAGLEGTVTDLSGAVIPGAAVTLVDTARGISRQSMTDSAGQYRFVSVPPTTYDLRASHPAFQTQLKEGILLNVGQNSIVDFSLK